MVSGQAEPLTATVAVTGCSGACTPTGSVTFTVGTTTLGAPTLTGTPGNSATATAAVDVPIADVAGAYTVVADYGGVSGTFSRPVRAASTSPWSGRHDDVDHADPGWVHRAERHGGAVPGDGHGDRAAGWRGPDRAVQWAVDGAFVGAVTVLDSGGESVSP